jgi:hypothetical protein
MDDTTAMADFYSCNGSKSGCEAERFGGCLYHRVGRWKQMAALRERIRDEAQTGPCRTVVRR